MIIVLMNYCLTRPKIDFDKPFRKIILPTFFVLEIRSALIITYLVIDYFIPLIETHTNFEFRHAAIGGM